MSRARGLFLALVLVGATAACGSDQDPGFEAPPGDGSKVTSHLLEPCPPGGPDETTPDAGCLDEDGTVVRPAGTG